VLTINNGYFVTHYVLQENHIERSLLLKTFNIRKEVNQSFCFAVLILSHGKTSKWLAVFEIAL